MRGNHTGHGRTTVTIEQDDWGFSEFNRETANVEKFLRENDVGNTSVPHRQNRALLFDSGLFHQSEPFRFKQGESRAELPRKKGAMEDH